jgi:hypothetical protein
VFLVGREFRTASKCVRNAPACPAWQKTSDEDFVHRQPLDCGHKINSSIKFKINLLTPERLLILNVAIMVPFSANMDLEG